MNYWRTDSVLLGMSLLAGSLRSELAADNRYLKQLRTLCVCLHPCAPHECEGPIAGCHSVQRRAEGLEAIARHGHVYGYKSDLFRLADAHGRVELALIGIGNASRFYGFCASHDSKLFAPIENYQFDGSAVQRWLQMYRITSHIVWKKRVAVRANEHLKHSAPDSPISARLAFLRDCDARYLASVDDLGVAESIKARLDASVLSGHLSQLRSAVIWTDRPIPALAAAATYPRYDFQGKKLQEIVFGKIPAVIAISLISTDKRGALVLTWEKDAKPAAALVDSLLRLDRHDIPGAVLRFVLHHCEDYYLSPDWWEALPGGQRKTVLSHINSARRAPLDEIRSNWYESRRRLDMGVAVDQIQIEP